MTSTLSTPTPGPWRSSPLNVIYSNGKESKDREVTECFTITGDQGRKVGLVSCGLPGPVDATDKANASLIAAAPELLEALRIVADYLAGRGTQYVPDVEAVIAAAIAKAEGRDV